MNPHVGNPTADFKSAVSAIPPLERVLRQIRTANLPIKSRLLYLLSYQNINKMVQSMGLEPIHLTALVPKTSVSAIPPRLQ